MKVGKTNYKAVLEMAGHKPKTDEEALLTCEGCSNLRGVWQKKCAILGVITVESRHACYLAGYCDHGTRLDLPETKGFKHPKHPPCQ